MTVVNTGTVRLKNIQLTEATPLTPDCPITPVLAPGENSTCEVQLAVDQTHFDAQEAATSPLALSVTATGTFNVSSAALSVSTPATQFTGLTLPVNRSMSVVASVIPTSVTLTGKSSKTCWLLHGSNTGHASLHVLAHLTAQFVVW